MYIDPPRIPEEMIIFNTDNNTHYVYRQSKWIALCPNGKNCQK